jgi:DNA-directed RNA polymerase subunit beta'
MGHIELAAPTVHIWYLRGTRSWLAYLLMGTEVREELKAKQLEKVIYFDANLVTWVDEDRRHEDLPNLEAEKNTEKDEVAQQRDVELARMLEDHENAIAELEKEGAKDDDLKARTKAFEKDQAVVREQYETELETLDRAFDEFGKMFARQIIDDEMLWRELVYRYGDYFEGGMGADAIKQLIERRSPRIDLQQLIVPPLHLRQPRQRQSSRVGERQGRGHPEVCIGDLVAHEPGSAFELGIEDGCVVPEFPLGLRQHGGVCLFV